MARAAPALPTQLLPASSEMAAIISISGTRVLVMTRDLLVPSLA
jgi:hypothetical protein